MCKHEHSFSFPPQTLRMRQPASCALKLLPHDAAHELFPPVSTGSSRLAECHKTPLPTDLPRTGVAPGGTQFLPIVTANCGIIRENANLSRRYAEFLWRILRKPVRVTISPLHLFESAVPICPGDFFLRRAFRRRYAFAIEKSSRHIGLQPEFRAERSNRYHD